MTDKPKSFSTIRTPPSVILTNIRIILAANGLSDASEDMCRTWARSFIKRYDPAWEPGAELAPEMCRLIGGAFERKVARSRRQLLRAAKLQ